MIITVLLPNGSTAKLDVLDTDLVFDGLEFVSPTHLSYVELYTLSVEALTLVFSYDQIGPQQITAAVRIRAMVLGAEPQVVTATDPQVVSAVDPSGGQCVCGITCNGTELRFVRVQLEN